MEAGIRSLQTQIGLTSEADVIIDTYPTKGSIVISDILFSALKLTGGPILRWLKRVFIEVRVGIAVRRKLRKAGYTVHSKPLREVMYEPGFRDRLVQQPRADDELDRALSSVIVPSTPESIALLRQTLTKAFRAGLEGSTQSSEFREDRADARHDEAMSTFAAVDESAWQARLNAMPPLRVEELCDLRIEWPMVTRLIADLATAPDRAEHLRRLATYPPNYLEGAPASVFGLLADMAAELPAPDDQRTSVRLIEVGLGRGLQPAGYWMLRLSGAQGITDLAEADQFLRDVRDYPLVKGALRDGGIEGAIKNLEQWNAPSKREDLQRRVMLADLYLGSKRIDDGVTLSRETADLYDSTSAAMAAVRALVARQMIQPSPAHAADLSTALQMVMEARAKRRQWGLESGTALALEIRVRRALTDQQGVLDLVNGIGELPATSEEFQHADVAAEAALFHAEFGDIDVAKRLLSTAPPAKREQVSAVIAESEGRHDEAVTHWQAAVEQTEDWGEKADLALQLAFQGVRAEFVDQLGPENAEAAEELTMIAALYGQEPGALEAFRGLANANYRGTLFLYMYYKKVGDEDAAAAVARDGAARWGDPDLWVASAKSRIAGGQTPEAIADLQNALSSATDAWGGRAGAYRHLVEAHSANGDWQGALTAAGRLLADQPGSTGAAWAVVICQVKTHDLPGALRTWREHGTPEPQTHNEVAAWIELVTEYGAEVGTAQDALRISARFPTEEDVQGALLGAFFFGRRPDGDGSEDEPDEETPDPDRDAFREMLQNYVEHFPEGAIRPVAIDMANPLQSMQDLIGDRPRNVELEEQISTGGAPLGLAGLMYGKGYLETLLARDHGPVFSASRDTEAERTAIEHAHAVGAVLDLSAVVTIARLPEQIRPQLIGHFANARVLREQHTDAVNGARLKRRESGMTYRPGIDGDVGTVEQIDEEAVAAQSTLADRVEASFAQFATDSHPAITAFEPVAERDFNQTFLLGADHAVDADLTLWVDDFALKELVRQQGGHAFGTPELMVHLRTEEIIDEALVDLAEAHLIAAGYVGIRFRRPVWDLAAGLAGSPFGLANAIRNAGGDDVPDRAEFAVEMINTHVGDPSELATFVHAMAQWLINIAADEPTAARSLQVLTADMLRRPWISSSTLPYCVNAFRATTGKADAVPILLRGIFRYYEILAARTSHEEAALVVFDLISRLDPPDAHRVRAAILSGAFE